MATPAMRRRALLLPPRRATVPVADPAAASLVSLLPGSVRDARAEAFTRLVDRIAEAPIAGLLVRRLPSVPDPVLPALAWEADVLDTPAWSSAATPVAQRSVLGEAIVRHRRRGTPWAVRRALQDLGWPAATIDDARLRNLLDGSWKLDGTRQFGERAWWAFAVALGVLPATRAFTLADAAAVQAAADAWRPARSRLVEIRLALEVTSTIAVLPAASAITHVAFGTGGAPGLIPLTNAVRRRRIDVVPVAGGLRITWRVPALRGAGLVVRELALTDEAGAVLARVVRAPLARPVPSDVQAGVSMTGTWLLTTA